MVLHSLVRRGMDLVSSPNDDMPPVKFNGGLAALFFFTVFAFFVVLFSVEYTYGMVVTTLAAVEDSNPDVYVRIDADHDATKPIGDEPEALAAPPKPITSKLRTTVRHLRARAGFWSRFRGFVLFIIYTHASTFLYGISPVSAQNVIGQFFVNVIAAALLANLQLAWVHTVISEPSPKRFYQRIPGYKAWLQIAPVAALQQAIFAAALFIPVGVASASGVLNGLAFKPGAAPVAGMIAAFVLPMLLAYLVIIPVRAIFIRVAASMLPEEDESIVPFDRSFGGKVVPALLGGSGRLGIADAWKTFDAPARMRYFKAVGKAMAIQFAVILLFSGVLAAEVLAGAVTFEERQ